MEYKGRHRLYKGPFMTSEFFEDVVPSKITPRKVSAAPYVYTHNTPFKEVDIVSYEENPEITKFLDEMKVRPRSMEDIFESVVESIKESWNPNKLHVVGASSGYDSRVIAKALQVLRKKHGDVWFGDTLFVENGGEREGFRAIMKTLGFRKFTSWEPDYTVKYFDNIHIKYNGICSYPVNQWYDYYVKQGFDFRTTQYITGYGNNEVTEAVRIKSKYVKGIDKKAPPTERLRQYFKWHYYHQLATFREFTETVHPFWNFRFISTMAGTDNLPTRLSEILAKTLVSECNHIKKMVTKDVTRAGHRTVDKKVIDTLHEKYKETRWGQIHDVVPSQDIYYNNWWQNFCTASYVEANDIEIL